MKKDRNRNHTCDKQYCNDEYCVYKDGAKIEIYIYKMRNGYCERKMV